MLRRSANKKKLVTDLMVKAKQIEYLINSLPEPEPEEEQGDRAGPLFPFIKPTNNPHPKSQYIPLQRLPIHTSIPSIG